MAAFFIKQESKVNGLELNIGDFVFSGDMEKGNFGEARYTLYYTEKKYIDEFEDNWENFPKDKMFTHTCNFTQLVNLIIKNK